MPSFARIWKWPRRPLARARTIARSRAHGRTTRIQQPRPVKENTRDIRGRNSFLGIGSDLRAGLRTSRKNPGFAAILVLTLGLGIGANIGIFNLNDPVMARSLPASHPEQLVQVRIP